MLCAPIAVVVALALVPQETPGAKPGDALLVLRARVPYGLAGAAGAIEVFEGAFLVKNGRIAELYASEPDPSSQPGVRILDAGGHIVLPGLIDAHTHFVEGSLGLLRPNLLDTRSADELYRRLAAAAAELPKGSWILGTGWDHEGWPGAELPTAAQLDAHVAEHPVFVTRTDGHMALANGPALRLGRIDASTPDPAGGFIVRRADSREPAGVLKDEAMNLVSLRIPPEPPERRREAFDRGQAHALELGITGICDMGSAADWELYRGALARGELDLRIDFFAPLDDRQRVRASRSPDAERLRLRGIKTFVDGSLGSSTAWFDEPYSNRPGDRGLPMAGVEPDGGPLAKRIAAARTEGYALAVHAIGDRANAWILDHFAAWSGVENARVLQRIEHAQHLRESDIERIAALGVIASMQPYHVADDGRWALGRIGAERARRAYAFRSLLDAGAVLAFGSDWPVAPLSPWLGLHAAVTRETRDGKYPGGWVPEQKISRKEALLAYTRGSALACGDETRRGRIAAGFLADFVVLERDPEQVPDSELGTLRVAVTVVGGRVLFQR